METWLRKGKPALFSALATVCNQIEQDFRAELRQYVGADDIVEVPNFRLKHAGLEFSRPRKQSLDTVPLNLAPVDQSAVSTNPVPLTHSTFSTTSASKIDAVPEHQSVGAANQKHVSVDLAAEGLSWKEKFAQLRVRHNDLVASYEALNYELAKAKLILKERLENRKKWIAYAERLEKELEINGGHNPTEVPRPTREDSSGHTGKIGDTTFVIDVLPVSKHGASNISHDSTVFALEINPAPLPHGVNERSNISPSIPEHYISESTQEEVPDYESSAAGLPPLRAQRKDSVVIKREPSSDLPMIVMERVVKKRKRQDSERPQEVKREAASHLSTIARKRLSSPRDCLDLDEYSRLETPRKQRDLLFDVPITGKERNIFPAGEISTAVGQAVDALLGSSSRENGVADAMRLTRPPSQRFEPGRYSDVPPRLSPKDGMCSPTTANQVSHSIAHAPDEQNIDLQPLPTSLRPIRDPRLAERCFSAFKPISPNSRRSMPRKGVSIVGKAARRAFNFGVQKLAENGLNYGTESIIPSSIADDEGPASCLEAILNTPPSFSHPAVRKLKPISRLNLKKAAQAQPSGSKRRKLPFNTPTPKNLAGIDRSTTLTSESAVPSRPTSKGAGPTHQLTSTSHDRSSTVQVVGLDAQKLGQTEATVCLRRRPLSKLEANDFKINPKFNDGQDFAFSEVVRGSERALLPGCVDKDCCGKDFRDMALLELPDCSLTGAQKLERLNLLEKYLGDDSHRLAWISKYEQDELWVEARTWQLANQYGKHRQRFPRAKSPPGFWSADFPTTQELQEEREEGQKREREVVAERHRQAMRPGGKWLFRDEA